MKSATLSAILLFAVGTFADEAPEAQAVSLAEATAQLAKAREAFAEAIAKVAEFDAEALHEVHGPHPFESIQLSGQDDAMLGVVIRDADEGVYVAGVTPDSGAEAAGIRVDDIIVAINGMALAAEPHPGKTLREAMTEVEPGEAVAIAFLRDGEERDVEVTATARPHPAKSIRWRMGRPSGPDAFWAFRGAPHHRRGPFHQEEPELELVDIGEDLGKYFGVDAGVLVLDTPPGSNLRPGDILRRIDDADIRNAEEAYRLLADLDEDGTASIRRESRSRNVKVEPMEMQASHFNFILRGHEDSQEMEEEIELERVHTTEPHGAAFRR